MLEATDRVVLKTVIRAWLESGMAIGANAEDFATLLGLSVVKACTTDGKLNQPVLESFLAAFNEVGLEMIAETEGLAFKVGTSTDRHPNFD